MPSEQQYGSKPLIEIAGTPLRAESEALLEETVVANHRHLPDMFVLRFRNDGGEVLKRAGIDLGVGVTISATARSDGTQTRLIVGEVVAVEVEYDRSGSHATARGYDLAHRLMRGRATRTFTQVTDEDMARQIAGDQGIEMGTVDIESVVHEYIPQVNTTDYDFLHGLGVRGGFEVDVDDGKLNLKRPRVSTEGPETGDVQTGDPLQLTLGNNLESFRSRVTAAEQVKEVTVRSWDPRQKEAIVSTAPARTRTVAVAVQPEELAGLFGCKPAYVVHDRPVENQAEAYLAATAVAEQIASAHAEAFGTAPGNPLLKAGEPVSIGLLGHPHDGKYTLTVTTHRYAEDGYKTEFEVTGRQERSLSGLTGASAVAGGERAINGVVTALVTDVADPEGLGRVRLMLPWLDDDYQSWWARMVQFGAGEQRGAVFLPEVNDEVLVAFEHGDVRRPFVIGSLHNGKDIPPLGDDIVDGTTGAVKHRGFVSRAGHKLVFFDDEADLSIALVTADESQGISLEQTEQIIRITSQGRIQIESQDALDLSTPGNVSVASSGNVSIEASGNLELKAGGTVTIDGAMINIG